MVFECDIKLCFYFVFFQIECSGIIDHAKKIIEANKLDKSECCKVELFVKLNTFLVFGSHRVHVLAFFDTKTAMLCDVGFLLQVFSFDWSVSNCLYKHLLSILICPLTCVIFSYLLSSDSYNRNDTRHVD